MLELECATLDGSKLELEPKPTSDTLVGIDLSDSYVYLTEEQVITLIQYLEALIIGGSHVE